MRPLLASSGIRAGDVASPTSLEMPSGAFVELLGPHPDDIVLFDIAHNLSNECRFGGTCSVHYSVAEHAVLVARELRRRGTHPTTVLMGLHHDDHEAYLKDLPAPLKRALDSLAPGAYKALADVFDLSISHSLGLDVKQPDGSMMRGSSVEVKEVDDWALGIEAVTMMPSKGVGWVPPRLLPSAEHLIEAHLTIENVRHCTPYDVRQQFLVEHERCMEEAGG
jgi:hypothetical protein